MNLKKILKKKKLNQYILILAIVFLSVIPIIRFLLYDSIAIGQGSYYHLRIAEQITKTGIPNYDDLSNLPYVLNPLHLVLGLFTYVLGEKITSVLFPFVLGLLSLFIYLKILERFNFDPVKKFFVSVILVTSPIFLYTFSTINSFSLPIFLNLLGFYFFIKDEKRFFFFKKNDINFYISILIFALIPFFGLFNLLITIVILLAYASFKKNKLRNFYVLTFILLLVSLVYSPKAIYPFFFPKDFNLSIVMLSNVLFELGATGFRVFMLLLVILGFFKFWAEDNKRTPVLIFLVLFILSFFMRNIIFYLNFVMMIAAAYGLLMLFNTRWKVQLIKNLTLTILIAGLLIASFSSIGIVSSSLPDKQTVNSLEWLKLNSDENEKVLSYFTNSFWIQKIADKSTFTDPILRNIPAYANLFNISSQIFYSRSITQTTDLLKNNNITYIWINKDMKEGLVWTKPGQGLLFLLENSETFKNIYSRDNIEIWKFNSSRSED